MIEVERKFGASPAIVEQLKANATPSARHELHETYYDSNTYFLTLHDWWLRKRNDRFELKIPLAQYPNSVKNLVRKYHEIDTESAIYTQLGITPTTTLEHDLLSAGYTPYAQWTSIRTTYILGDFRIEIDTTDFGHHILEIELMVEREEDIPAASHTIGQLAQTYGISLDRIESKNATYLKWFRPDHHRALQQAGIMV